MPIANTTIRLRKSATPGNQPTNLANGEIAINYADGRIYYLNANGSIASISGGGSSSYSFSTINVNSSLVLATSPTDILTLAGANGITVTACTSSKVITIGTTGTVGIDTYARDTANGAASLAQAAFDKANTGGTGGSVSSSGYLANSIIFANASGYLSNTNNLQFFTSNNNFVVTGNVIGGGVRTTSSASAPASPTPGDIWYKTTNDKIYRYTYDGSNSYWIDINTPIFASNGTISIDSWARDTANVIIGVDLTQNTNITYATGLAQAAFDKANTGVSTSTDDYARTLANTATNNIVILQGVDTTQNTRISSVDNTANAAYAKANAAFDKANTGGSGSSSGYLANSVIFANTTGYLTNTSALQFFTSNNNFVVTGNVIGGGVRSTTSPTAPDSPTPGDIWYKTTNDKLYRYTYDGTGSYWIDVNTPAFAANGVVSIDSYARDTANSAQANTIYSQGVDTTQNTRITVLEGGLISANSNTVYLNSLITTNNTRISVIEGGLISANANSAYLQGALNTANTNINTKFNSSGGTISGSVTISGNNDLIVTGNLIITGNISSQNVQQLAVADPLLVLGLGNYVSDTKDIGFASHYNDGANAHTGLIRDSGSKEYHFFTGYTPEVDASNNIDINHVSYSGANVNANFFKGNLIATAAVVGGVNLLDVNTSQNTRMSVIEGGLISANANTIYLNSLISTNNTRISSTDNTATGAYNKANAAFDKANTTSSIDMVSPFLLMGA